MTEVAGCDEPVAQSCLGGDTAHPRWVLAACILASSLAFLDGSVVMVALPAIVRGLRADAAALQWTLNAYTLPLSALLLIGGATGDHFGRRRLLVGGIALFAAASIVCAIAPSLDVLLGARAAQGVGAAMLMPNSLAILGNAFSGEARGRAIGTWAAVGAIASAVGPPLGGWLVEAIGWRAIFYINVPVAAAGIVIALRFVEEQRQGGGQPLDWTGAALATVALGALTWALTIWSSSGGMDTVAWITLAVGPAALGAFVATEWRKGERAMMPLGLFASRAFGGLTLLTFLLYGALGGLLVLLPYVLIQAGDYTPLQAGFALLTLLAPRATYWIGVFPGMVVIALGMSGAVAPLTTAVLSSVDDRHTGTASGFNSAISRTGGLIATALSGAVIAESGTALIGAFHGAALVAAVAAFGAAVTAFLTLSGDISP